MSSVSSETVVIFCAVGCIGCFLCAAYYYWRAVTNQTGPTRHGKHMKNYSGRFESDCLPVFVNLVTAIQYLGETMEESRGEYGFFNHFRFGSYLITCPLMIWELIDTIGAPYSVSMAVLTLVTLLCALMADISSDPAERWAWFSFGGILYSCLAWQIYSSMKYANKLNAGLCNQLEDMNNDLKGMEHADDVLPTGMLRIETPMDRAQTYINSAFYLMFSIWPLFPLFFVLEQAGAVDRNGTQVAYALADLVCKTLHSFFLDEYKHGLRQTVFAYGFLDTQILHEIEIDDDRNIYSQLKDLSRATYGNLLTSNKEKRPSSGVDFQRMLVANRRNQAVDVDNSDDDDEYLKQFNPPMPLKAMGRARSNSFRNLDRSRTPSADTERVDSAGNTPTGSQEGKRSTSSIAPDPIFRASDRNSLPPKGNAIAPGYWKH